MTTTKTAATYVPRTDSDNLNADFIFSLTHNELLCAIVDGRIDPVEYAKKQLANRGYNAKNEWVGFKQAAAELGIK